jgi:hypothetical protein
VGLSELRMKHNKRKLLLTIGIILSSICLFVNVSLVKAVLDTSNYINILYQLNDGIMESTPATRYYKVLMWSHNQDLMDYVKTQSIPSTADMKHVFDLWMPNIQALVEDQGSDAIITAEQVKALKDELTHIRDDSQGSLRVDITKELHRFPLDIFIGKSMTEALNYINKNWSPDYEYAGEE